MERQLIDATIYAERKGQCADFEKIFDSPATSATVPASIAGDPNNTLVRDFSALAIELVEPLSVLIDRAEALAGAAENAKLENLHRVAMVVLADLHQALSCIFRLVSLLAGFHALRTTTQSDLITYVLTSALSGMEKLPQFLRQYENTEGAEEPELDSPDTFYFGLGEKIVDLVRGFEGMCERHPERFRYLARELPYWPVLVTKHKAGYRQRFECMVGKGSLDLGSHCPLDTSRRAMYRLETPVCGLLWEEVFRDWLAVSAGVRALRYRAAGANEPVDAAKERKEIEDALNHCCGGEAERETLRDAFALPELSKSTANQWAERFVVPYLHFKFPDWKAVPALTKFMGKKGGDTQAEREIRRAVCAMARD